MANSEKPSIQSPSDLKGMQLHDLQALADELRQLIVSTCLRNGGHLGASLGAVELAIALHFVFDSPREPLVWDVGHQAYAHKLLTGRWDRFATLRQENGISGFLTRTESEHDVFGAGHSSTAISAALGMAFARAGTNDWTIAVVGDGGLTAGVALEALNNARANPTGPLLVLLNDNQMSISANVGALPQIFGSDRARELFDLFGFDYVGPVDGHNLHELIGTLQSLKARSGPGMHPILLHVLTQKGKGYGPAEESPAVYHGIGPVQEKIPGKPLPSKQKTYSDAFGEAMCELAALDPKVVAITAAMPEGTGLTGFSRRFPDRFFDVGIAEQHAVTFAAGLATQGYKPVVAIYSTFLQRALDAIIHDVALQDLGVVFAIDRAGLVGADGPTHHGMFDLAYLGMIPGITVSAPACLNDVKRELATALASGKPWSIRYPRGSGPHELPGSEDSTPPQTGSPKTPELSQVPCTSWRPAVEHPEVIAVALGAVGPRMIMAAQNAAIPHSVDLTSNTVRRGAISVAIVTRAKPIDPVLIQAINAAPRAALLIAEEGALRGGFGQALLASLAPRRAPVHLAGYPDHFVPHGTPEALEAKVGLSAKALEIKMRELLDEKAN